MLPKRLLPIVPLMLLLPGLTNFAIAQDPNPQVVPDPIQNGGKSNAKLGAPQPAINEKDQLVPKVEFLPVPRSVLVDQYVNAPTLFRFGSPIAFTAELVGVPSTSRYTERRFFDNRFGAPQALNASFYEVLPGIPFETNFFGVPNRNYVAPDPVRFDIFGVRPSLENPAAPFKVIDIPVKGDKFYGTGWNSTVAVGTARIEAGSHTATAVGPLKLYYEADFFGTMNDDGQATSGSQLRRLYVQLANLGAGDADSVFSDVFAQPTTINKEGPNALMYVKQPHLWYFLPFSEANVDNRLEFSIERPKAEISAGAITDTRAVSRFPDMVVGMKLKDATTYHFHGAAVVRSLALETADNSFQQSVIGWGGTVTCVLTPFQNWPILNNDSFCGGVAYGQGIAHYNKDLTGKPYDAAIDAAGDLRALPFGSYYVSYSHNWTPQYRSVATVSRVTVDSEISQAKAFRNGDFAAANLIYTAPNGKLQLGVEYLFGRKETVSGAAGEEHRIQLAVAYGY